MLHILVSKIVHNDYDYDYAGDDGEEAAATAHVEMSASNYLQRETKHTQPLVSGIDKKIDERILVLKFGDTMHGNQTHRQATYWPKWEDCVN